MADQPKVPLAARKRGFRAAVPQDGKSRISRHLLGRLAEHLEEAAAAFYAGDGTKVDELFQLWCVGERARESCLAEGRGVEPDAVPRG